VTFSQSIANDFDFTNVQLERIGTTDMPDSGSVTMQGVTSLVGVFGNGSSTSPMEGKVDLMASFSEGSGSVSGRTYDIFIFTLVGEERYRFENLAITLEQTSISGGGFSGATSSSDPLMSNGTYDGLFVGSDAQEAVGTYSFERLGAVWTGIFSAEEQTP